MGIPNSFDEPFDELFANSPVAFAPGGRLISRLYGVPSATVTPAGFDFTLDLSLVPITYGAYLVPICSILDPSTHTPTDTLLCIRVERLDSVRTYIRVRYGRRALFELHRDKWANGQVRTIVLRRNIKDREFLGNGARDAYGFELPDSPCISGCQIREIASRTISNTSGLRLNTGMTGVAGIVRILIPGGDGVCMHSGFDFDFNAFCLVTRFPAERETDGFLNLPLLNGRGVSIYSNQDIMRVVDYMQAGRHLCDVADSRIVLNVLKWSKLSESFEIDDIGYVTLETQGGIWRRWLRVAFGGGSVKGQVERSSAAADRDEWQMLPLPPVKTQTE